MPAKGSSVDTLVVGGGLIGLLWTSYQIAKTILGEDPIGRVVHLVSQLFS